MKDEKKRAALKEYETVIRDACAVRKATVTAAEEAFQRTKRDAHKKYLKEATYVGT